ncbi:protein SON-like [Sinocyclocheilus rhinocerous]|uniref:protein SON-like n=1 Tax=Sinocyclocheilus rhinocerous TaxID=307959 RepID=UPI0007B85A3E|nr:PREDICTED: protein SON-like [Sinocyclocheilus rhinocerous]
MSHSLTASRFSWFASLSLCLDLSRSTQDQFLRAAPVSGGMGELLMRKMGWRSGEGLGKHREGTVEPIIIDFKTDRKGLVAEGEKTQKSGNIVVMKDLLGECLITRHVCVSG